MNRAVLSSMTVAERRLVAETSREAMAELDEEELLRCTRGYGVPGRST